MKFNFKKQLQPDAEFTRKTKGRFLAAFDAHFASPVASRFGFTLKIVGSALAVILILVGAGSAYADTSNVPADNVLYPLKRLGEDVQLAVASPSAKAQLQATFSVRRIDEINDLAARKPTSTMIAGLATDLDASVSSSVSDADQDKLADGALNTFCGKLLSAIVTSSAPVYENLLGNSKTLVRFERTCAGSMSVSVGMNAGASSTISAAILPRHEMPVGSSTASSTTHIDLFDYLRNRLEILNNKNSGGTSTVETSSSLNGTGHFPHTPPVGPFHAATSSTTNALPALPTSVKILP